MALSEQTLESLRKAEVHLRDTLAFAARVEKPYVVRELGAMISHLDQVTNTESFFDKIDEAVKKVEEEYDSD